MNIDILTLFPDMFSSVMESSILGRAQKNNLIKVNTINIRDFSLDKHKKADDYPFGGGAGMVMMAQPIFDAIHSVNGENKRILYMSPKGKILDQRMIEELSKEPELVILCGHYEGMDERVIEYWNVEEVSVGDYILTGGELPAMILIDAMARLIPDVLGSSEAHREESIYSGLLEYPQYTKPRNFQDLLVPEVLVSGNHKLIHLWQFEESCRITKERRPDLWSRFIQKKDELTKDEKKIVEKYLSDD